MVFTVFATLNHKWLPTYQKDTEVFLIFEITLWAGASENLTNRHGNLVSYTRTKNQIVGWQQQNTEK